MTTLLTYLNRPEVDSRGAPPPTLGGHAHEIIPGLFLGPIETCIARDEIVNTVTGIVNCCPNDCVNAYEDVIEYCIVSINDIETADILPWLMPATAFIDRHISTGGKCLVHCHYGVSRSSTVVIAYLMRYRHLSLEDAYVLARSKRSLVNPNQGFWLQLKTFEGKLTGKPNIDVLEKGHLKFDDDWMNNNFIIFCASSGNAQELFSELVADCSNDSHIMQDNSKPRDILELGINFVIGKGLSEHTLKFFRALAYVCSGLIPNREAIDNSVSPTYSTVGSKTSEAVLQIIDSENFQDLWGSDFRYRDRVQLLSALDESR